MKKCVNPRDKKKKKELGDEILRLETDLEERQKLELDTFKPIESKEEVNVSSMSAQMSNLSIEPSNAPVKIVTDEDGGMNTPLSTSIPGTPKLSRAQKRREKKSTKEKERQKRIENETEMLVENSDWKKEDNVLEALLKDLQLEVFEVAADGHW